MKKFILVPLFILFLAGHGFAIGTSIWVRSYFMPVLDGDGAIDSEGESEAGTGAMVGPHWGNPIQMSLGMNGANSAGTAGFDLNFRLIYDYSSALYSPSHVYSFCDLWVKPFDADLSLVLGRFDRQELSGYALGNSSFQENTNFFSWIRPAGAFEKFLNQIGALITYGLPGTFYVAANLGVTGGKEASLSTVYEHGLADNFTLGQYAVAWTMPDVIRVMAQFHGGRIDAKDWKNTLDYQVRDYSFFQIYARPLFFSGFFGIDATVTLPLPYTTPSSGVNADDRANMGGPVFVGDLDVDSGATFRLAFYLQPTSLFKFRFAGSFDLGSTYRSTDEVDKGAAGHTFIVNVEPEINFSGSFLVAVNAGYRRIGDGEFNGIKAATGRADLVVMPFMEMRFPSGSFRTGLGFYSNLYRNSGDTDKMRIAVPVIVEFSL